MDDLTPKASPLRPLESCADILFAQDIEAAWWGRDGMLAELRTRKMDGTVGFHPIRDRLDMDGFRAALKDVGIETTPTGATTLARAVQYNLLELRNPGLASTYASSTRTPLFTAPERQKPIFGKRKPDSGLDL